MNPVTGELTKKKLASAIEKQWNSFIKSYSTGKNTQYETTNDYNKLVTNTPIPMLNGYTNINLQSTEIIDELARHFQTNNQPFSWCISPSTTPSNLDEILSHKGYSNGMQMLGMAIKLEKESSFETPSNLEIRLAHQTSDLQTFFKVLVIAGWGMGEDFVERFTELQINDQTIGDRVVHRYIGYSNGTPIATGQIIFEHGVAGLFNISTLPSYRKKGVGTAITYELMNKAQENGFDWCVLHASPMGEPIYEKIGYQTICHIRYLNWIPK